MQGGGAGAFSGQGKRIAWLLFPLIRVSIVAGGRPAFIHTSCCFNWSRGLWPVHRLDMRGGEPNVCASLAGRDKKIVFIRHGVTEMNEFLGSSHYGSPGFKDPGFWDTRLTTRGVAQATALNRQLLKKAANWATDADPAAAIDDCQPIDLLVCSPLTRALQTASIVFASEPLTSIPRVVNADIRERMWLSSDVGTPADELAASWADQGWDCSGLSNVWWYTDEEWQPELRDWRKPGIYVHAGEPESPFKQRLENFKAWLLARPEARIAVVAHWGSIYGLTGKSLENCEALELRLEQFQDLNIFVTD